jgi:RIO kinase 1
MSRKIQFDPSSELNENEEMATLPRFERIVKKQTSRKKSEQKQSYEASPDVQRWLQLEAGSAGVLEKPSFTPTFLAGQRDAAWILSSLSLFYDEDLIRDVLHVVKSGKEANVYCCAAEPITGLTYAAAKVYRPRMFRSLRNDAAYRLNRAQRDVDGRVMRTNTGHQQEAYRSTRGRAMQVLTWIEYEYQTQQLLFDAGASVPRPLAQMGNAVLMDYVGDLGEPAPLLREVRLSATEAGPLFDQLLYNIELFLAHHRVHGDLSEYNILYWDGEVKIIDFAQAVDPSTGDDEGVYPLFQRDVERVCRHFANYGVKSDADAIARDIWQRHMGRRY